MDAALVFDFTERFRSFATNFSACRWHECAVEMLETIVQKFASTGNAISREKWSISRI